MVIAFAPFVQVVVANIPKLPQDNWACSHRPGAMVDYWEICDAINLNMT
jgi:uncharacterized membrane protein